MEENNMEQAMTNWLSEEVKKYCNADGMIETYWDYQDREALNDEIKRYAADFEGGDLIEHIADQMRDENWYLNWCDEYEDDFFAGIRNDAPTIEDEELRNYVVDKLENMDYTDLRDELEVAGYNGVDDGIESELKNVKVNVNLTLATDNEANYDMSSIITCFGTDYLPVEFDSLDASHLDNALTYLIHQQGHTLKEFYDSYLGNADGGKLLKSIGAEVDNNPAEATCGLTVLVSVNMGEYGAILSNEGNIEVSADTELGLYNSWIGGGSVFEIALEKPFVFPASMVLHADLDDITGTGAYSVGDTYGTMGEDRSGTVKKGGEASVVNEDLDAVADYVRATYDNGEEVEEGKNVSNKLTLMQEKFADDDDDDDDEDEDDDDEDEDYDDDDDEDIDFNDLTKEQLWELREEIVLGSLYINDYENSFGIDPEAVCGFFDSFIEDASQDDDGEYNDADIEDFDNPDALYDYYSSCEYPFGDLEESKKITEAEDLSYIDSDANRCKVYYAVNTSGYKSLGLIVNDKDKKFQVVAGQKLSSGSKTAKKSKKQIWNMAKELKANGYEEVRGPSSVAGMVDESKKLKTEGLRQDTIDAIDLAINEIDNGNSDDPDWFNERYDTYDKLVQGVLDLIKSNVKYGSGVEKEPTSAVNFSGKDEIIKEIKKQLAEWGYKESDFGKKTEDIANMGDLRDSIDTENLIEPEDEFEIVFDSDVGDLTDIKNADADELEQGGELASLYRKGEDNKIVVTLEYGDGFFINTYYWNGEEMFPDLIESIEIAITPETTEKDIKNIMIRQYNRIVNE